MGLIVLLLWLDVVLGREALRLVLRMTCAGVLEPPPSARDVISEPS